MPKSALSQSTGGGTRFLESKGTDRRADAARTGRRTLTDRVDKASRSRNMAAVAGKDTKPEVLLRSTLHAAGFRFRLHAPELPGRPDIVLPRYRAAIFVHGCFWHRHVGCRRGSAPSSNVEFWRAKLDGNVQRDARNISLLLALGWRVAVVWECGLHAKMVPEITSKVSQWLRSSCTTFEAPAAACRTC